MAKNRMDKGSLMFTPRFIRSLVIPLLIETALNVTIGLLDAVMVSSIGEHAVSGVSLIDQISNLIVFLFTAFATGGAVIASQYLGSKDREKACLAAKQLIYISIAFSLLLSIILLAIRKSFVSFIYGSLEENVMDAAISYFIPILISYPFLAVTNSANAICRSMGKSTITMAVSFVMNVLNLLGNMLFIFVFGLGPAGAGISSLISRAVAAVIMLIAVTDKRQIVHISKPFRFEPDFPMMRRILSIALPSGIENCVFQLGRLLVTSTIASFGTASIAANAVIGSIGTIANIPGNAIGMASVTVIGQCCGAGRYDQADYYGKYFLKLTYMMLGALGIMLMLLTKDLCGLYSLSEEAMELSVKGTYILLMNCILFWPLAFVTPNYLRAAGDVRFTLAVSMGSMWIFRIVLSFVLGVYLRLGLLGVYYGMFIDWYCRIILFNTRFARGKWKNRKVI